MAPEEAVRACRAMAARSYATGGWSVGAVGTVAGWLARTRPPGTRIAAVFPDGPQRYFDTVYNDEFCAGARTGGRRSAACTTPERSSGLTRCAVERWTRCRTVLDPRGPRVRGDAQLMRILERYRSPSTGRSSCCCSTS